MFGSCAPSSTSSVSESSINSSDMRREGTLRKRRRTLKAARDNHYCCEQWIEMQELPSWLHGSGHMRSHTSTADARQSDYHEEQDFWRYKSRHLDVGQLRSSEVTAATALEYLHAVEELLADQRLMLAGELAEKLQTFFSAVDVGAVPLAPAALELFNSPAFQSSLVQLRTRVSECRQSIRDLESDDGWIFAQRLLGVTTYYQMNDDGSVRVKLDGAVQGCQAFDILAVLRETDLYQDFVPFCNGSRVVHEFCKTEMLMWFQIVIPFVLLRDAVLHVYTCDITEEGFVMFVGESVDEMEGIELPPEPSGWGMRMAIRGLRVRIKFTSTSSCHISVLTTVDARAPLPMPVLNFCVKRIAGMLVWFLKRRALRMVKDPRGDALAQRVRCSAFYTEFLMARVEDYNASAGWDTLLPAALGVERELGVRMVRRRRADTTEHAETYGTRLASLRVGREEGLHGVIASRGPASRDEALGGGVGVCRPNACSITVRRRRVLDAVGVAAARLREMGCLWSSSSVVVLLVLVMWPDVEHVKATAAGLMLLQGLWLFG